jgi:DNA-damage-inducible protein J
LQSFEAPASRAQDEGDGAVVLHPIALGGDREKAYVCPVASTDAGKRSPQFLDCVSQIRCGFDEQERTMATHTSMLHVRVDDETKEQATAALNAMGLSVSDAVRLFLRRVVAEQRFPLELEVPNAKTRAAVAEAEEIVTARRARFTTADELFADLEKDSGE